MVLVMFSLWARFQCPPLELIQIAPFVFIFKNSTRYNFIPKLHSRNRIKVHTIDRLFLKRRTPVHLIFKMLTDGLQNVV